MPSTCSITARPTGFRLAVANPERVAAIISQNGNGYVDGLGDAWDPIKKYWKNPSAANREALRQFVGFEGTKWQYIHGVSDPQLVEPEAYWLDTALLQRPGNVEIQLDLFLDYASNVKLYPTFQEYFRKYQPPLLAAWGKNDPFFIPPGAEAFRRDIPSAKVWCSTIRGISRWKPTRRRFRIKLLVLKRVGPDRKVIAFGFVRFGDGMSGSNCTKYRWQVTRNRSILAIRLEPTTKQKGNET